MSRFFLATALLALAHAQQPSCIGADATDTCHSCDDDCEVLWTFDTDSAQTCACACRNNQQCAFWTHNHDQGVCHIKTAKTDASEGNCTSGATTRAAPASDTPNIIWLMCDSMDGRVLDPTSPVSARVATPHLDALAASGVNFVRTYAASPQCVPSRTSMMAGRYNHHLRAGYSNMLGIAAAPDGALDAACVSDWDAAHCAAWRDAQDSTPTIPDALAATHTVNIFGKTDVGAGVNARFGPAPTADGFHGGKQSSNLNIITRAADVRRATKPDPVSITNDEDNNVHPEDWAMVDRCVDFLGEQGDSTGWVLHCSVNIPHPAFQTNATWLAMVNESAIDVPPWIDEADMHPADAYMTTSKAVERNFSDEEILTVRKTYYAMVAETDYLMGRVLDAARATSTWNNTYVVFVSDHGEMNMEHRQVWKNSMYEASERVPFIVAGPGVPAARVVRNLTSLLDVMPTLIDLARGAKPAYLDGASVAPFWDGSAPARNEFVAAAYHSNMGNTGSFMLRKGPWKYITFGRAFDAFADYQPQLFNVDDDPEELVDVAESTPDVVAELDVLLRGEIDYDAVDQEVKASDQQIFRDYFSNESDANLTSQLSVVYTGFDEGDLDKVKKWIAQSPAH